MSDQNTYASSSELAQAILSGKAKGEKITRTLRENYFLGYVQEVGNLLIKLSGATASNHPAIAGFSTIVKKAVPKDPTGRVLTCKFKQVKTLTRKSEKSKTLVAEAAVYEEAEKNDELAIIASASVILAHALDLADTALILQAWQMAVSLLKSCRSKKGAEKGKTLLREAVTQVVDIVHYDLSPDQKRLQQDVMLSDAGAL